MHQIYPSSTPSLYPLYTFSIPSLYPLYIFSIPSLYPIYILSIPLYTLSIPSLYLLYTLSIPSLYLLYTFSIPSLYPLYILSIPLWVSISFCNKCLTPIFLYKFIFIHTQNYQTLSSLPNTGRSSMYLSTHKAIKHYPLYRTLVGLVCIYPHTKLSDSILSTKPW